MTRAYLTFPIIKRFPWMPVLSLNFLLFVKDWLRVHDITIIYRCLYFVVSSLIYKNDLVIKRQYATFTKCFYCYPTKIKSKLQNNGIAYFLFNFLNQFA